jgi:hypothetical protein
VLQGALMDRVEAYRVVGPRVNAMRAESWDALAARVERGMVSEVVWVGGQALEIETEVSWVGEGERELRVTVRANGPSHWRLERLEESFRVKAPG